MLARFQVKSHRKHGHRGQGPSHQPHAALEAQRPPVARPYASLGKEEDHPIRPCASGLGKVT